jgi:site-specific DNA recombinase
VDRELVRCPTSLVERTRRGKLYPARMGLYLNWDGHPPNGYRLLSGTKRAPPKVTIEESEASWIRAMFAGMTQESLSTMRSAKRWNERGVMPRRTACGTTGSVRHVLTNPAYSGTAFYNRTEGVEPRRRRRPTEYPRSLKTSRRLRPQEAWVSIPVPAIVEASVQERAIEEMRRHRRVYARSQRYAFLLSGRLACGDCGLSMTAVATRPYARYRNHPHPRGGRTMYPYYICRGNALPPEDTGRRTKCRMRRVRADRLDPLVWASVEGLLQRPASVRAEMEIFLRSRQEAGPSERGEEARLQSREGELARQKARLVDAYPAGLLRLEDLRLRGERIEREEGAARRRRAELQALREEEAKVTETLRDAEAFCSRLRAGLNRLSFDERRRLVRMLVERVVVKGGGEVTVEHILPLRRADEFCESRVHRRDVVPFRVVDSGPSEGCCERELDRFLDEPDGDGEFSDRQRFLGMTSECSGSPDAIGGEFLAHPASSRTENGVPGGATQYHRPSDSSLR